MKRSSLLHKTIISVSIIILVISGTFLYTFKKNSEYLKEGALKEISLIASTYEGLVYQFLEMSKRRAEDFSTDGFIKAKLTETNKNSAGSGESLSLHLTKNKLPVDKTLNKISVITPDGLILASTDRKLEGSRFENKKLLARMLNSPMVAEGSLDLSAEIIASAPVLTDSGDVKGAVINHIRLSALTALLSGEFLKELGAVSWQKSGTEAMKVYIVDMNLKKIVESLPDGPISTTFEVDTEPVQRCLQSKSSMSGFYTDYRGIKVAGASKCMPQLGWTLIVEYEEMATLSSLDLLLRTAGLSATAIFGLIGIFFYLLSSSVIKPLRAIASATSQMASGNYDISIPVLSSDELGTLSEAFNSMAAEIKARDLKLRKSEAHLEKAQQIAKMGSYEWNLSTGLVQRSMQVYSILGVSPDALEPTHEAFLRLVHPDDRELVTKNMRVAIQNKETRGFDFRIVRPDGKVMHISAEAEAEFDAKGNPVKIAGTVQDITIRKETEKKLVKVNRMLTLLSECNQALVRATEEDILLQRLCNIIVEFGDYRGASIALLRNGCVHTAITKNAPDISADNAKKVFTALAEANGPIERALSTGRLVVMQDISSDITSKQFAASAMEHGFSSLVSLPIIAEMKIIGALTVLCEEANHYDERLIDLFLELGGDLTYGITSIKTRENLKASEEKYRTLFEESRDVVFMGTPDGKVLDVNPAGLKLFGFDSKEEMSGVDIASLYFNPGERDAFKKELSRNGYISDYELTLKNRNGEKIFAMVTANVVCDKSGNVVAYRGILHDITNFKKLEAQLLQAQKMEAIGKLTGGIAHDFNNILTAIIGYGSLLRRNINELDPSREYLESILSSAERAANLTRSLLAFSRKQPQDLKPLELNNILKGMKKLLLRLIGEDIDFRTALADDDLVIVGDVSQIEQILLNLSTNAHDAMPRGGSFTISTEKITLDENFNRNHGYGKPGLYALLTASDTGEGMDAQTREKVFEPFFTTKEVGKGTGLGLSIVYGIVKQHDGFINVYSEPGEGTIFRIYLPLSSRHHVDADTIEISRPLGGSETLLVAEDELEIRKLMRILLEESGYKVIEAENGREAFEKFKENSDDIKLLLLDVIMPYKNGKEVFEEARKIRPEVGAVFISGYTREIVHKKGLLEGEADLISKPFSAQQVLRKIREVLDR